MMGMFFLVVDQTEYDADRRYNTCRSIIQTSDLFNNIFMSAVSPGGGGLKLLSLKTVPRRKVL